MLPTVAMFTSFAATLLLAAALVFPSQSDHAPPTPAAGCKGNEYGQYAMNKHRHCTTHNTDTHTMGTQSAHVNYHALHTTHHI